MIARAARWFAPALLAISFLAQPAHAAIVTMHSDPSAATVAIEFWYRAPAAGYDFKSPGIARLALAAAAASKPSGGSSVSELVNRLGGTLSFAVYPDIAMVGASVPAQSASAVMRAMQGAYFASSITETGLKTAVQDSAIAAAQIPYDSERVLQDALFAQLFSSGPAHYAPVPEATAFGQLSQSDVQAFASRAFGRQNLVLSVAGNIDSQLVQDAQSLAGSSTGAPIDSMAASAPADFTLSGKEAGIGFGWIGPPIADTRAATAMDFIADYLFDPDHGVVSKSLSAQRDIFAGGQFVTLHDPGVLVVTISGDTANDYRQNVLDAIDKLRVPMDPKTFADARNAFVYHILSQVQTPVERADSNGWYAAEGNADYSPGASGSYVAAANALDPQYVADTVRKYLMARPAFVRLMKSTGGETTAR